VTGDPQGRRDDQPLLLRAPFAVAGLALAGVSMLAPFGAVVAAVSLVLAVVAKRRGEVLAGIALAVTCVAVLVNLVLPLALDASR
jgi:hypothetical protein